MVETKIMYNLEGFSSTACRRSDGAVESSGGADGRQNQGGKDDESAVAPGDDRGQTTRAREIEPVCDPALPLSSPPHKHPQLFPSNLPCLSTDESFHLRYFLCFGGVCVGLSAPWAALDPFGVAVAESTTRSLD